MASVELRKYVDQLNNHIRVHGITEDVADAYKQASEVALLTEKDDKFGLKVSNNAKIVLDTFVQNRTGGNVWDLERYSQDNDIQYELTDKYYQILLAEAQYNLESFMLYMEKKRYYKDRFYQPRINPLHQVAQGIQNMIDGNLQEIFINCPSRVGKLLADDTPILTSKGWKNHGDLIVGDKVIGSDGKFTKIIHVHPKFNTTHTVTTTDGEKIECHFRHEWTVYDRSKHKWITQETKDLIGKVKVNEGGKERNNLYFPLKPIMQGTTQKLQVDPYVLGAWLGDGHNQQPRISNSQQDHAVIDEIVKRGYNISSKRVHKITGVISTDFVGLRKDLQSIGMCFSRYRTEKHIPQEYLIANVNQRLDLLAGLLDTDGTLIKDEKKYQYSTTAKELKDNIVTLVSTFGWRVGVSEYEPKLSSSGIHGRKIVYVISFRPTIHIPCKLERKKLYKFGKQRRIAIESIVESEQKQGNCITVENKDGLYMAGKKLTPTHNTQIVKFAFLWYGSKFPEKSNLYTAYSDKITSGFYDGILELILDPTYTYAEIFPKNVENKPITDGKDLTIDLIRKKTYPTFTMRSIYGTLNGACDCSGLGVADDLFSGIEEAISTDRQITVWGKFDNNFMKRLKRKAMLINMGTRWAPLDVQGRRRSLLEENEEYKDRKWDAIIIPALDDNDESNFDYPYDLGYSTQDYRMIRASFEENDDMASWYAQDQQEPTDREGALFTVGNMKYFNPDDLPDRIPDRIFAAVDPAYGGGDYVSMPICYQYDNRYYVIDAVYNDGDKKVTVPEVVNRIAYHLDKYNNKTAEVHYEETKTTTEYRTLCEDGWRTLGVAVNTTHDAAPNKISKIDRIKNHAPDIKNLYFLESKYRTKEYNKYFQNIITFKTNGKVKHDDGVDSTAQLCDMIYGDRRRIAKIEAGVNPFRTGGCGRYGY